MKCKSILWALFICFYGPLMAQIEDRNLFPTPNAAGLGLYGQVPVDYFTGLPNIDIPVYEFKSRDISIPIHLTYHSAGIKPSDHASWVGLGWNLQAGGMITRIQNDLPDELVDYGFGITIPRGFFYNYGYLSSPNWQSSDSLINVEALERDQVTAATYIGTHYRIDYGPDEFQFNFLGISGSLIMGQDGQWHLKSKEGLNFSVTTEIGPYFVWEPSPNPAMDANYPSMVVKCLTKFILTAADGTQYSFGSDTATNTHGGQTTSIYGYFSNVDSNAVEFNRMGAGYGNSGSRGRDGGTVPVTWYLTKIKSPTGDSISLQYTRDGYQIMTSTVTFGSYSNCATCSPVEDYTYGIGDDIYILDGSTLSSITGANGTVQFMKSKANELDYTFFGPQTSPPDEAWFSGSTGLFDAYSNEVFQRATLGTSPKSTFMELDTIVINDAAGTRLRSYQFNYTSSSLNRLFLNSIQPIGGDGVPIPPYSFTYNNINGLNGVPYGTPSVDHWGYYNDVYPYAGLFPTNQQIATYDSTTQSWVGYYNDYNGSGGAFINAFDSIFNATYIANRAPVSGPMQYGILTQIRYPTGGNTQFAWEPGTYSKCVNESQSSPKTLSVTVQDLGSTITGGGIRIHQIASQANYNSPVLTKTYFYDRDYVNNNLTSSGVLNSAQPSYVDTYNSPNNYFYRMWSSTSVYPMHYTNGSPVTYTNVTELNSDGGFNIYTYSNHDNGYADQAPDSVLYTYFSGIDPILQEVTTNSMELERGLLLNEVTFKAGNTKLKNTAYQYNNSSTRFNNSIRRYQYNFKFSLSGASLSFDDGGFLTSSTAFPIYMGDIVTPINMFIDYPFLQSETKTEYDQNGLNPMTTVITDTYDNYRNKKTEQFTGSKGENITDSLNYAADAISGISTAAQQAQTGMVAAGMLGISLEKKRTVNNVQTEHSRLDYQIYAPSNNILVPVTSYQSSYGYTLDTLTHYVNFDNEGNILQYISRDGVPVSFDWGYNQCYPTVKINNASNNYPTSKNYFYDGFEENSNASVVSGTSHTGIKYWGASTYPTGFTPPDNNSYIIEWWNLNAGVWTYNKQAYTTGMQLTGPVDDVRIFPAGSLMSTYTYKPSVGILSEIDPKGFTTYYFYDGLGRLTAVKDKDGNVLKTIEYHFDGQ